MRAATPRANSGSLLSIKGALFTVPLVCYLLMWVVGPAFYGVFISFTNESFLGPAHLLGAANYAALLHNPSWWQSVTLTCEYLAWVVPIALIIAFAGAYVLNRIPWGKAFYLTIFFLPYVVPAAASAIVFELMLQPGGLVNQLIGHQIAWLTTPGDALTALSLVTAWSLFGFYVVIFLAGMQTIPREVLDASAVDGANVLQRLRHIELPILRPTVLFSTVTCVAYVLTNFTTVYVLTQGGPGTATQVLPMLIYRTAFQYSEGGLAAAMAVILFVGSLVLTALQFGIAARRGARLWK